METTQIMTHDQAFYLLKHFTEIDPITHHQFHEYGYSENEINDQLKLIGSKFHSSFCHNPFQLETQLTDIEPIAKIIQSNGRIASVYQFDHNIGTEQIVSKGSVNQQDIFQLERNGVNINAIHIEHLPLTKSIVVVRSNEGAWITAFPGQYAPAFPSSWMNRKELEFASEFWKNHVFVIKASVDS